MAKEENPKLISNTGAVIDIIVAAAFYLFMVNVLTDHVPAETPSKIWFWAAFSAIPLGGTCWFAVSMFHVTLVDYLRKK